MVNRDASIVKLNLGSGNHYIDGWINVDQASKRDGSYGKISSSFKEPDLQADITALPLPDNYADEAMAIHVIEHFHVWEAVPVIREWVRVLKPGGKLILECPSLPKILALANVPQVPPDFTYWGLFGDPKWQDPAMMHKWCYGPVQLGKFMNDAGLANVREEPPLFHQRIRDMRLTGIKFVAEEAPKLEIAK